MEKYDNDFESVSVDGEDEHDASTNLYNEVLANLDPPPPARPPLPTEVIPPPTENTLPLPSPPLEGTPLARPDVVRSVETVQRMESPAALEKSAIEKFSKHENVEAALASLTLEEGIALFKACESRMITHRAYEVYRSDLVCAFRAIQLTGGVDRLSVEEAHALREALRGRFFLSEQASPMPWSPRLRPGSR
jgi:hypothetical protein